ncbi:MAG TPA: response regulator [Syntrophorhabdaceae bacterium]|jgi:CheY-like chemotaxis protein|nr:response regulator [Syntrophorhabdaceae bacterium]MDI9562278.1 response regulator [Pseudomonadota bacterium]MBP8697714.1 response regulator [Syntrophorhabdaceae bacterium]MBV6504481.1 Response regulator MprA [Syntrophorhabdaceae bacterium]HNQ62705.1 response regulator [Syntrophorhabdaceae bacterium]
MSDNPMKILIVDDDQDIRLLLDFNLSGEGYEVLEATHGAEALDIIKTGEVNLVVTDLSMPVMDGYELIKNLKDNPETSKIPVLLLTGQEEERVSIEGMVHPPNDFIPKPFAKADLLEKVKKLLSQGV